MNPSQSVGRNEPCPCGSGRKFKACCREKSLTQPVSRSPARWVVLGLLGLLVAVAIGKAASDAVSRNRAKNTPETATSAGAMLPAQARPMSGTTPQPFGLAPPGKVWSPEHGHWHDAPGAAGQVVAPGANVNLAATPSNPTPQPPGPAPEGKVWSPEHGHWHDAPGAAGQVVASGANVNPAATTANPTPQPPGPAPEGKVWSPEHGHWHDAPAVASPTVTVPVETFPPLLTPSEPAPAAPVPSKPK